MILKFTSPSERIKGLSFHPQRPWLLAGLHTGSIQLWDYRLQIILERFHEHEGPVRSVQFHPTLSLFASGGDDFTVRVWNYKSKKCVFILRGHLDFVRCVAFHSELPWVISSSDDQTARIWNYQSRQMIAILTGHSHYVMNCAFHPTKDLIITASLDQTLRLWSFTQLRKKYATKKSQDITLSGSEIELTQIMEGHNAGVNWCQFHPRENLIVSGSDDKKIKIWKFTDTRCIEYDQFSGHTNNVSSAVFHPKMEVLISNSEDRTTRIWDLNKKVEVDCYTNKELDRFWVVAVHPASFTFACGSDSALYVFSLIKERVPFSLVDGKYLCVAERKTVKVVHIHHKAETIIKQLEKLSIVKDNILLDNIDQISYNSYDSVKTQLLVRLRLPRGSNERAKHLIVTYDPQSRSPNQKDGEAFLAKNAVFIGSSKVLCLDEHKQMWVYNYESSQQQACPSEPVDRILPALGGKVFIVCESKMSIFDPVTKTTSASVELQGDMAKIKSVSWSGSNNYYVAVLSKRCITVLTKGLKKLCVVQEKMNIKGAVWIEESILIYSTKAQIKYLILNGDNGVIRSTENKVYLASCEKNAQNKWILFGIDHLYQLIQQEIDIDEALFKQALYEKNMKAILSYLQSKKSLGDSLVSYLFQKNQPSLAMKLVKDPRAKFSLAIDSNNLETSFELCKELQDSDSYTLLSREAIRQGNQDIAEEAFKTLREFDRLSFLYALQGHRAKLGNMLEIAKKRKNADSRIYNANLIGDVKERVLALADQAQFGLAYLSALTYGLQDEANRIKIQFKGDIELNQNLEASRKWLCSQQQYALMPVQPIVKASGSSNLFAMNWPHNYIAEEQMIILQGDKDLLKEEIEKENNQQDVLLGAYTQKTRQEEKFNEPEDEDGGQWGIDDTELIADVVSPTIKTKQPIDMDSFRSGIPTALKQKLNQSKFLIDQITLGDFAKSMSQFKSNSPIRSLIQHNLLTQKIMLPNIPFLFHNETIIRDINTKDPYNKYFLRDIKELMKKGYKNTTEGKFQETHKVFQDALQKTIFLKTYSIEEAQELKSTINLIRNYIVAMSLELNKKQQTESKVIELGCLMACCNLQPAHKILTLRAAMTLAYKLKNFLTASLLAQKLINLIESAPPNSPYAKVEIAQNAKKVKNASEQQGTNAFDILPSLNQLLNNEKAVDYICSVSLTVPQSPMKLKCPVDESLYSQHVDVCIICGICRIA